MTWILLLGLSCGADPQPGVEAGLRFKPLSACADPTRRSAEGPLELLDGGESWQEGQAFAEVETRHIHGGGVSAADFDDDGLMDLHLPGSPGGGQLFMGEPGGRWVEQGRARLRGLDPTDGGLGTASVVVDVEGDGDADLFLCQLSGRNVLLLNDGQGGFDPADLDWPEQERACMGAVFGDMDGDEDLDLFVTSTLLCDLNDDRGSGAEACGQGWDEVAPQALFEQVAPLDFLDVSERLDADALVRGLGHVSTWIDLDEDLDLDLYVVNDRMRVAAELEGNEAWLNDGAGAFTRAGAALGLDVALEGMGLGLGDLNDDGLPDMAVAATDRFALLLSAPDGTWIDAAAAWGLTLDPEDPRDDAWGTELVDLDNDGDLDLVSAFGWTPGRPFDRLAQPDALWIQEAPGRLVESSAAWGFDGEGVGRGLIVTDLDEDGWLDLVVRDLYGPARIFKARCGEEAALIVDLEQDGPNRDALGARVELSAGGRVQVRWIGGGTGLFGSAPYVAHFGLGEAEAVDWLRVRWPDGEEQVFEDLDAHQRVIIGRSRAGSPR